MFQLRIEGAEVATVPVPLAVAGTDEHRSASPLSKDERQFIAGVHNVEHITGKIRLFRETGISIDGAIGHSRTLCAIAVPCSLSSADFCQYVGPYAKCIEHMRVIRDAARLDSRSMVLMRFNSQENADRFFRSYNGKPFIRHTQNCYVLYVSQVILAPTEPPAGPAPSSDSRLLPSDPLCTPPQLDAVGSGCAGVASAASAALSELPICPVCLERLDPRVSGVLTTLCNHTFHCTCLSKWMDDTCPVCRYCMADDEENDEGGKSVHCELCEENENLWMCMVCGHVGCGRYSSEHALVHYKLSGHAYSIELSTQRVWNYANDEYVHRLIINKTDGKLIELPNPDDEPRRGDRLVGVEAHDSTEKTEAVAFEYTLLLTSQLEAQRQYYEGRMIQLMTLIPDTDTESKVMAEEIIWGGGRGHRLEGSASQPSRPRDGAVAKRALIARTGPLKQEDALCARCKAVIAEGGTAERGLCSEDAARSSLQERYDDLWAQYMQLRHHVQNAERRAMTAQRERKNMARLHEESSGVISALESEVAFLKDVNDNHAANAERWRKQLDTAHSEAKAQACAAAEKIKDLEEQLRDAYFCLETQQKIERAPSEVKEDIRRGHVLITTDAPVRARRKAANRHVSITATVPISVPDLAPAGTAAMAEACSDSCGQAGSEFPSIVVDHTAVEPTKRKKKHGSGKH